MRLESVIKVTVRNTVIGGPEPLVCLPLVAAEKDDLLEQAAVLKEYGPDLVEWRVDAYKGVENTEDCLTALAGLRSAIGDIPLIFTCRVEAEGGMQAISQPTRKALIEAAIRSGEVDIVDIELINDFDFIEAIRKVAREHDTRLILSCHDFKKTPAEDYIFDRLNEAQTLGADIAKMAVMPENYKDVLTLLSATLKARTRTVRIPIVTMSMAREGAVTRLAGGLFGSDITFAIGKASSAPGQVPISELREAMSLLYN